MGGLHYIVRGQAETAEVIIVSDGRQDVESRAGKRRGLGKSTVIEGLCIVVTLGHIREQERERGGTRTARRF